MEWDTASYMQGKGLPTLTEGRYREVLQKYYKTAGAAQVSVKLFKKWNTVTSS